MIIRVLIFIPLALSLVVLILYLIQPYLLFPAALWSLGQREFSPVPAGIDPTFIRAKDGTELDRWHKAPAGPGNGYTLLLFHGNGETLWNLQHLMAGLAERGFEVFAVDYRGFARSKGVPSPRGVYEDADALFDSVVGSPGVDPGKVIPIGISIGTGFAAYLAAKHDTPAAVLFAPYVNIPDIVRESPPYAPLWKLVRFDIPSLKFIASLKRTRVIAVHGAKDTIIRPWHSAELERAYRGSGSFTRIVDENASHNDLLWYTWDSTVAALEKTLSDDGAHALEQPSQ